MTADSAVETFQGWSPPPGMSKPTAASWTAFYRAAWTTYGVTPRFYRQMYLAQMGRCYICRVARGKHPDDPKGLGGRRLGIDHNHVIGNRVEAVRGLLCTGGDKTCNRIIGWLNHGQLMRAVELLEDPPAQRLRAAGDNFTDAELAGWLIP